eukprot:597597-Pelagomonas_calceolata.AAC.1
MQTALLSPAPAWHVVWISDRRKCCNECGKVKDMAGGQKKKQWTSCQNPRREPQKDHPPPLPPKYCPPPHEKGINLLLFRFPIHPHTQCNEKLSCSRFIGQQLSSGRPCIPALPGTHNRLA